MFQPSKHFHLKRKPKAAALKADLMQKSQEAANKVKLSNSSAFPSRIRYSSALFIKYVLKLNYVFYIQ